MDFEHHKSTEEKADGKVISMDKQHKINRTREKDVYLIYGWSVALLLSKFI